MTSSSILRRSIVLVRIWIRLFIGKPIRLRLVDRRNGLLRRQAWHRRFWFWRGHRVYSHINLLSQATAFGLPLFREVVA